MTEVFLVFPHQLFPLEKLDRSIKDFALIEDELFFSQYDFHIQKLVFHRASMKEYESLLKDIDCRVNYYSNQDFTTLKKVLIDLKSKGVNKLLSFEPHDYLLKRRLIRESERLNLDIAFTKSPLFLSKPENDLDLLNKNRNYLMGRFYNKQRERFNILVTDSGEPVGGQWSFDEDNRKKLPKNKTTPLVYQVKNPSGLEKAIEHIKDHYPDAQGELKGFNWATNREEAKKVLANFLEYRFAEYGAYQDAITKNSDFVFHSLISPYLNSGLLLPGEVVDEALKFAQKNEIPINSLEGFIRQIIGWREYLMLLYQKEGVYMRTHNFFGFNRSMPRAFYEGQTGIPPVDDAIKKSLKHAYAHHIERLMLLGNFMLLCEINPDEVYQWFMELYIDAYDWVMVPNVYGMSQYADGGLICTKPYISGSNYVLKMSDYSKGDWATTWNALYWRFLHVHRSKFEDNFRMKMMLRMLDKMNPETLNKHLERAEDFLQKLD